MSRYYSMTVRVSGNNPRMAKAIMAAETKEWPFVDWEEEVEENEDDRKELICMADGFLCRGRAMATSPSG